MRPIQRSSSAALVSATSAAPQLPQKWAASAYSVAHCGHAGMEDLSQPNAGVATPLDSAPVPNRSAVGRPRPRSIAPPAPLLPTGPDPPDPDQDEPAILLLRATTTLAYYTPLSRGAAVGGDLGAGRRALARWV